MITLPRKKGWTFFPGDLYSPVNPIYLFEIKSQSA